MCAYAPGAPPLPSSGSSTPPGNWPLQRNLSGALDVVDLWDRFILLADADEAPGAYRPCLGGGKSSPAVDHRHKKLPELSGPCNRQVALDRPRKCSPLIIPREAGVPHGSILVAQRLAIILDEIEGAIVPCIDLHLQRPAWQGIRVLHNRCQRQHCASTDKRWYLSVVRLASHVHRPFDEVHRPVLQAARLIEGPKASLAMLGCLGDVGGPQSVP
mmetsp:Transcript_107933/g.315611  ORF Transcript_107933/g.315611 Transcript_107933/m.315611 type:complete len:215 (-) Transcript_107933:1876-2520(-)